MKPFLKYLVKVLFVAVASMTLLHLAYTGVYRNAVRNKFQYVMKMPPQQLDYVFLGSSRTANHIVPDIVRQRTGGTAINLGIEGAVPGDNLLELKMLVARGVRIRKVFLQMDYVYEKQGVSTIANQAALPFMGEPVVGDFLKPRMPDFYAQCYVPFYRYMANDYRLGFREFFFSAIGRKNGIDMSDGFIPRQKETGELGDFPWPEQISDDNETVEQFRTICRENNIELVLFCAPVCSGSANSNYLAMLKKRLPDLRDYSAALPDEDFANCGHLHREGAIKFTELITRDCIKPGR